MMWDQEIHVKDQESGSIFIMYRCIKCSAWVHDPNKHDADHFRTDGLISHVD